MTVLPATGKIASELEHEEPAGERKARMAQNRRPYGSGCVISTPKGLAIRWRETIMKDGKGRRVLRYEALGHVSRKEAAKKLREKLRTADVPREAPITFEELAREWVRSILPMYKYSTRKTHRHILNKHLLPMFWDAQIDPALPATGAGLYRRVEPDRLCAAFNPPPSRGIERCAANGGVLEPYQRQSRAGRFIAQTRTQASEGSVDAEAGSGLTARVTHQDANDGCAGDSFRIAEGGTAGLAVEGSR